MGIFEAFVLAVVEGITEFLPVSSTAHLILTSELLGLQQDSFAKAFEIIIQMAPILSVMVIFREKIVQNIELWKKLIVSFVPTGAVGFLFHKQIEALFSSGSTVMWMILTGLAFLAVEYLWKEKEHHIAEVEEVSYKQAFLIGCFQSISLIPGVSRSGTTILGAMLLGLKREASMTFSFLLAIPTMTVASGYVFVKEFHGFDFSHIELLAVGFVVSFIVGWLAVKSFLAIVSRYSFKPFGVYLIVSSLLFIS